MDSENYTVACRKITKLANGMTLDSHAQSDIPAEPEEVSQPCIFFTGSFITDYSYVFTRSLEFSRKGKDGSRRYNEVNCIYVYNYPRLVFRGTPKAFLRWVERRRTPEPYILPPDQSAKATVERLLQ